MEDQYLIPGESWIDETASSEQFNITGEVFVDDDTSGGPGPGPGGNRRRPVIIGAG